MRKLFTSLALLAATSVGGQPVFQYNTHEGLKGIVVDGKNLLTGCGHNFIGSYTGSDDPDNISSCHAGGMTMVPMNGVGNKRLPHKLYYGLDATNASKLHFGGEIGVSAFDFATVSMPMDAHKSDFTHFRSSTEPSTYRKYTDIPFTYIANNDPAFRISVHPSYFAEWGETISPTWTIRYTMYGMTKPMRLYFVNHPDTRNVEFSFSQVYAGEKFHVLGSIEVTPTSPAALVAMGLAQPGTTYAGASTELYHNVGRQDGTGWSAGVQDPRNNYMVFGPYRTHQTGAATFSISLDNVTNDNLGIATLEVYNASTGVLLASKLISRRMLGAPNIPQPFRLPFINSTGVLEFRVLYHGDSFIKVHSISAN